MHKESHRVEAQGLELTQVILADGWLVPAVVISGARPALVPSRIDRDAGAATAQRREVDAAQQALAPRLDAKHCVDAKRG